MIRTDVHIMRIYLAVMHERGQREAANTHSMVQLLGRRVVNRSLFSPGQQPLQRRLLLPGTDDESLRADAGRADLPDGAGAADDVDGSARVLRR